MKAFSLNLLKWPAALGVSAGLLALAFVIHAAVKSEREEEDRDKVPREKKERKPGEVRIDSDKVEYPVVPARRVRGWTEPVTVFGRVVPNPQATSEVRSPFAGTLRKDPTGWPIPGQMVRGGQTVGWVDVLLSPQERLDLHNKLVEARQQELGSAKARVILEKRVKRFEGASRSLPPRELEDALVQLREVTTKEETARAAVKVWTQALAEVDQTPRPKGSRWTRRLAAPAAGEVTDLLAQPGTAVATGAVVARVVDFRRLVVRLDLPPELLHRGPPSSVKVRAGRSRPPALSGARNQPLSGSVGRTVLATLPRQAPQVDSASQMTGYFYEVDAAKNHLAWRPGQFIQAKMKDPSAAPRDAIAVPANALLYHQGRALIYVLVEKGSKETTYVRREVGVLGRQGKDWILAANPRQNVVAGVEVVARNAQELLAVEFLTEEDEEETPLGS
jgi:biotin carboxyl carrier protein